MGAGFAADQYMLDPDHAPDVPQDPDVSPKHAVAPSNPYYNGSGRVKQSYAFEFGYVIALVQAVKKSRGRSWEEVRTPQPSGGGGPWRPSL